MRIRFLVAYDIADDRRLRLVHRCMLGFGHALQYSVFICDLTDRELIALKISLRDLIHHREDAIVIVNLGPANERGRNCFEFMGITPELPSPGGPTIV